LVWLADQNECYQHDIKSLRICFFDSLNGIDIAKQTHPGWLE